MSVRPAYTSLTPAQANLFIATEAQRPQFRAANQHLTPAEVAGMQQNPPLWPGRKPVYTGKLEERGQLLRHHHHWLPHGQCARTQTRMACIPWVLAR